ncbi:MAG: ATP-binding protein [Fibrobacter sp.]|jgi:anti-sigma regulatory factor (Ser/Thr protein kinase)/anti-anti-sigma regulatory factor|nr:ATP-binding protein [Fibrobacter sp.]
MNDLQISVKTCDEEPEVTIVGLSGEAGLESIPNLVDRIESLIRDGKIHLLVDLSKITFLSAPVLGALMGCRAHLLHLAGSISFLLPHSELSANLDEMGAGLVFRYYENLNSFLEDFHWHYRNASRKLSLKVPSDCVYVSPLRHLVSRILLNKGYSSRDAFHLEMIVDELANNAMEHGSPEKPITLDLLLSHSSAVLTVRNECLSLSAESQKQLLNKFENPVIDINSSRGRGIALVKKLSDKVDVTLGDDWVQVCVSKRRERNKR